MSAMCHERTSVAASFDHFTGAADPRDFAERALRNICRGRADHSGLMLAARITLPHFSVSSAMSLLKSAGGPTKARAARAGERRLDRGIGEACVDLMVEHADDLGRRVLGRTDCNKCAGLEAWQDFAQCRHIRELIRARLSADRECAQLARPDMLNGRRQVVE